MLQKAVTILSVLILALLTWRVEGNYQRHRRHKLETPVVTNRIRTVIHSANGDPSAAIYEVRCYT